MQHALRATFALFAIASSMACTPSTTSDPRVPSASEQQHGRAQESVARSCLGVPNEQQAICPFERGHVLAVKPVREPVSPKGRDFLVGARIYVPATPGITAEWLGHRIACYHARLAEVAPAAPGGCPLVDASSKVRVDGTNTGFAVTVRSDDLETARAILRTSEMFAN
jgi:hypothetical protein